MQQIPRFGHDTNFHSKHKITHLPLIYSRKQVSFVSFNFCIHISHSKFADNTKMYGAVDMLEGGDVIHRTLTGLRGGSV